MAGPISVPLLASEITYQIASNQPGGIPASQLRSVLQDMNAQRAFIVTPQMFGAVGNGVVDDTVAVQAALNFAAPNGLLNYRVHFPVGIYLCTSDLVIPLANAIASNVDAAITISGEGRFGQSIIQFSGSGVTNGLYYNGGTDNFAWGITIRDLTINGLQADGITPTGAKRGITIHWASMPLVERVFVSGFVNNGIEFENCNIPTIQDSQLLVNGDASHAQLRVNKCTSAKIIDNYVAVGLVGCLGGVTINRSEVLMQGNALESCGTLILIANETETVSSCICDIHNNHMEFTTGAYIKAGYGFSTGVAVTGLRITGNTADNSPALAIMVDCNRINDFFAENNIFSPDSDPATAIYNFNGTTSSGITIGKSLNDVGRTTPWLVVNGSQVQEAGPRADYDSTRPQSCEVMQPMTSTQPLANSAGAQGGLFGFTQPNAGAPVTINTTAKVPSVQGYRLTILPGDGNTTIAHVGGSPPGQFFMLSAGNTMLTAFKPYNFIYALGYWIQY